MARTMTLREFAEVVHALRVARDPDAKRALRALDEESRPGGGCDETDRLGVYVLDDPRHDMHFLKSNGFLIYPETDL